MFKIFIGSEELDLEYEKDLELHEETINTDLKQQPSLFAFYAVVYEKAKADLNAAQLELDIKEAELGAKIRLELETNKKLTEKSIQARILLIPEYQKLREKMILKTEQVGILKGVRDAFVHRKESVIALASNMRVQADPSIYIGKKEAEKKLNYR